MCTLAVVYIVMCVSAICMKSSRIDLLPPNQPPKWWYSRSKARHASRQHQAALNVWKVSEPGRLTSPYVMSSDDVFKQKPTN